MIFVHNFRAIDAMEGMTGHFRLRYFRRVHNAFHMPVYPSRASAIVFRDKAGWSRSMAVRSKKQPANRKPRILLVFRQDFLQVFLLGGEKELVVYERNPACAAPVGVEAVLEDRPLLPDTGPFAQCDLTARYKRPGDWLAIIARIVVVEIEMFESNLQMKTNPFVKIRGGILEDETGGQIMQGAAASFGILNTQTLWTGSSWCRS